MLCNPSTFACISGFCLAYIECIGYILHIVYINLCRKSTNQSSNWAAPPLGGVAAKLIAKKWQQQCPQNAHFNDGYTPSSGTVGWGSNGKLNVNN